MLFSVFNCQFGSAEQCRHHRLHSQWEKLSTWLVTVTMTRVTGHLSQSRAFVSQLLPLAPTPFSWTQVSIFFNIQEFFEISM